MEKQVVVMNVVHEADNLLVSGLVDGVPSQGHGWVARTNHMTDDEIKNYLRELLLNGKPAHPTAWARHIDAAHSKPASKKTKRVLPAAVIGLAVFIHDALFYLLMHHH